MKRFPLLVLLLVSLFLAGCGGSTAQYTLTVTVEGDGEMDPAVGNTDYAAGTTVKLHPTAHAGSRAFDHWIGPDGGDVTDDRITVMDDRQSDHRRLHQAAIRSHGDRDAAGKRQGRYADRPPGERLRARADGAPDRLAQCRLCL